MNVRISCKESGILNIPPYKTTSFTIDPCTDGPVNCQVCQQPAPSCGCGIPVVPTACSSQPFDPNMPYGDNCIKPRVFMNCKNDCYELVQIAKTQTTTYKRLLPLKILENPQTIECDCPNLYMNTANQAWIQNGFLYTTFKTGKVYISYQGQLEDVEGNLLVPDHDMLNEYYEYALKKRILENLIMNDEVVPQAKIQIIQDGYMTSRRYALTIVNTPNFAEMKRLWQANRKAQYTKYYDMFKSYPWYTQDRNPNNFMGEQITR